MEERSPARPHINPGCSRRVVEVVVNVCSRVRSMLFILSLAREGESIQATVHTSRNRPFETI
jgi:hypothetical protein